MSDEHPNGILLVVDGIPGTTPGSEGDMAKHVLQSIGERYDSDLSKIYVPVDGGGNGQGLALIRCQHIRDAQEVISRNQGKVIAESHTLSIGSADSSSRLEALREQSLVDSNKTEALHYLDLSIGGA